MDVVDKVAVVTGGAYGIGRAIALALVDQGASVCLFDREAEPLRALVDEIEAKHPSRAIGVVGNVASTDDLQNMLKKREMSLGLSIYIVRTQGLPQPVLNLMIMSGQTL